MSLYRHKYEASNIITIATDTMAVKNERDRW